MIVQKTKQTLEQLHQSFWEWTQGSIYGHRACGNTVPRRDFSEVRFGIKMESDVHNILKSEVSFQILNVPCIFLAPLKLSIVVRWPSSSTGLPEIDIGQRLDAYSSGTISRKLNVDIHSNWTYGRP